MLNTSVLLATAGRHNYKVVSRLSDPHSALRTRLGYSYSGYCAADPPPEA